jgi:16S rRNA C967 or C1407 C5-methylase (RsmB/RsmF family)
MEVSGQLHAPAALGKSSQSPDPIWRQWQREEIPVPARIQTLVVQATTQSLYLLSYPTCCIKYDEGTNSTERVLKNVIISHL